MNERAFTTAAHRELHRVLTGPVEITKHSDRFTSDIPDSSIGWNGNTTWVEFKRLQPAGTIWDEIRIGQVIKLIALERSCRHAWAVAYRLQNSKHAAETLIYRPSALLNATGQELTPQPHLVHPDHFIDISNTLRVHGVCAFKGHNHRALCSLLEETHP